MKLSALPEAKATQICDEVTIRRRAECDASALLELFNEDVFQRMAATREPFSSCEELVVWLNGFSRRKFEIVAEVDGVVVGFAGLYLLEGRLDHTGWMCLGVRERLQCRGIGALLLDTLVVVADVLAGVQRVQLTVFSDNEAAIKLYDKFGFKLEGQHKNFLRREEVFVDALTMAKLFERGSTTTVERLRQIQKLRPFWTSATV
jgi:putative acetyltransferase